MYDTGIAVCPPDGYYTEVVPRSSLSKTGYMLANSVGIIDSSYRGSIKVVVTGDESLKSLELPFKGFQLVVRKQYHANFAEVDTIDETARGDGGFGSTGV
jgi:dUTP pyrophosphatase